MPDSADRVSESQRRAEEMADLPQDPLLPDPDDSLVNAVQALILIG